MSVLHLLATPDPVAAGGYEVGSGRLVPTVVAVLGLISVVLGVRSLIRAARTGTGDQRAAAVIALAAGLISVGVGGLHAANSAGGLGTGNGLAGAVIAVALGLLGAGTGGFALSRSRRPTAGSAVGSRRSR